MAADQELHWKANLLDRIHASRRPEELANKAIVSRGMRAIEAGQLDVLDGLVHPDYVEHDPTPGQGPGVEGLKAALGAVRGAFPDLSIVVEDVIAEADAVVTRSRSTGTHSGDFLGVPATGKQLRWTSTRLFRLRDGMVVETWQNTDVMGMLQQMGVVPAPPQPDPETIPPAPHLTGASSTPAANRDLMTRFIEEVWNKGNFDVADEVFHPQATSPSAAALPPGPAGVRLIAGMFRSAFPDYWMTIDTMVAEDDRVAARFTQGGTHQGELFGIPPTGKTVRFTETGILRVADGQVVESWYEVDMMGMMQQLGVGGG